ncbi:hypothetical protein GBA52_024824 [Prunus armeniaca]|nr:hypothetical protein GBA52_024824 [Prunus armeniaca]
MIEKGEEKRRIDRWKERMEETKLESNVRRRGGIKIGIYYLPSIGRYGIAPNEITNLEPVVPSSNGMIRYHSIYTSTPNGTT